MSSPLSGRMQALAAETGTSFEAGHEPSMWLRGRLVDLRNRFDSGQLSPCPHLRAGMVGAVALWRPDRIVCADCAPGLRLTGDADRTCDRCTAVADRVHPQVLAVTGALLVTFGLCPACHSREVAR